MGSRFEQSKVFLIDALMLCACVSCSAVFSKSCSLQFKAFFEHMVCT